MTIVNRYASTPNKLRLSLAVALVFLLKDRVICMEDYVLSNARKKIETEITKMKTEFGTQMATFPSIRYNTRGPKYQIDFLVDQRRVDVFTVLISALNSFDRSKEENGF